MKSLFRLIGFILFALVSVVAVQQLIKRAHRNGLLERGRKMFHR